MDVLVPTLRILYYIASTKGEEEGMWNEKEMMIYQKQLSKI